MYLFTPALIVSEDYLLSKHWSDILCQQVSSAYQPDVKQSCQQERFGTSLFEFLQTGICAQCRHGHCQHEGIDVLNGTVQWNIFYGLGSCEVLQQGVQTDDTDESECKILLFSALPSGFAFFRPANAKLMMTSTGASIMTRIILVMVAAS